MSALSRVPWMNRSEWFDAVWARFTRAIMFFGGVAIMGYETVDAHADRPWLYAAALGLMGVPLARSAEVLLGNWLGHGPQEAPPEAKKARRKAAK